jgi:hypothetical protein
MPAGPGRIRNRFAIKFRTSSARLAWLNATSAAFESEADISGDFTTKAYDGRYVEWR